MLTINSNLIAAVLGCLALVACRMFARKSGLRGYAWMFIGCALIVGVTLVYTYPVRLLHLAGIILSGSVLVLVLLCLSMLSQAHRKRGPRYQPPREMNGACSLCAKSTHLKHYRQGWLCRACAGRIDAKAA